MNESDDNVSSPATEGGEWTDEEMEAAEPMPLPEIDDDESAPEDESTPEG